MGKVIKSPLFRYVILSLLAVIIGVNIFAMNAAKLTGNQVPMPFGYGASVVLSGSMEPALSVGDLLIVKEEEKYTVGDIVVYQSGDMPVVHRIVSIEDEQVTTKGDANNVADEAVPIESIKGIVTKDIPFIGYIVWALKTPAALIIMLVLAVLLVEFSFRIGKKEDEMQKEKLKEEIRSLMKELEK